MVEQKSRKSFQFSKKKKFKSIIICAARVGGIKANNTYKADFIYENLTIQNNLIHGAFKSGTKNLIFLRLKLCLPKKLQAANKRKIFIIR